MSGSFLLRPTFFSLPQAWYLAVWKLSGIRNGSPVSLGGPGMLSVRSWSPSSQSHHPIFLLPSSLRAPQSQRSPYSLNTAASNHFWTLDILFTWTWVHASNWLWGYSYDFPGGLDGKASAYNVGDPGSIPGLGRSPGEGNGNPLQYPCLENPMDGGAW